MTGLAMGVDYKWSLRRGPDVLGKEEYEKVKGECHQRCAERMLDLCKANQGIYVKLGQHVAAMVFLLPEQYTQTMRPLQDRCPATPLEDIEALFQQDLGCSTGDMFLHFDPNPLGVASLAQVHRATLLTGQEVAVKVQHPYLDEYAPVDIATTALLVRIAKRLFDDFDFEWLAEEMQTSLPQELDFVNEAANANKVRGLFSDSQTLHIPDVYWAAHRVLIMEYANGGKIDDLAYYRSHGIDPAAVSAELSKVYSEMIYVHGFVHCDPHPGNVFVRPRRPSSFLARVPVIRHLLPASWTRNFEIVLLDHGLYRQLTDRFRLDYAHLWASILNGDEKGILTYSYRLFTHDNPRPEARDGIDHHRLFASMLTGRSWDVISSPSNGSGGGGSSNGGMGLAAVRTRKEQDTIRNKAGTTAFLVAIADILAKLPRELLLLLKTNDLLRAVDESLGVGAGGSGGDGVMEHVMRTVGVMGWYCARAIREEKVGEVRESGTWVWLRPAYWNAQYEFWKVGCKVWALGVWIRGRKVTRWIGGGKAQLVPPLDTI
ncbi:putative aarF domain-containing protein kinase 1 [Thoreauomyces humboldtii]|nr:putative aarF domain-containing protein kinase 1 [Thoreauomyces humboldtii]